MIWVLLSPVPWVQLFRAYFDFVPVTATWQGLKLRQLAPTMNGVEKNHDLLGFQKQHSRSASSKIYCNYTLCNSIIFPNFLSLPLYMESVFFPHAYGKGTVVTTPWEILRRCNIKWITPTYFSLHVPSVSPTTSCSQWQSIPGHFVFLGYKWFLFSGICSLLMTEGEKKKGQALMMFLWVVTELLVTDKFLDTVTVHFCM